MARWRRSRSASGRISATWTATRPARSSTAPTRLPKSTTSGPWSATCASRVPHGGWRAPAVPYTAVPDTAVPDPGVPDPSGKPRVGLFVTCLVDLYRPSIGFAAIELLTQAGCQVEVPEAQTCCGQPAYNSGNRALARELARGILDAFGGFDYVVAP